MYLSNSEGLDNVHPDETTNQMRQENGSPPNSNVGEKSFHRSESLRHRDSSPSFNLSSFAACF